MPTSTHPASPRPQASTLFDLASGTVAIGQLPDGTLTGPRLYDRIGALPTVITTTPGAGLSVLLSHLWAAERASGVVTSFAIDPARDDSQDPNLHRTASDPAEAVALLRRLTTVANDRFHDLATWQPFQPTTTRPLTTLTLIHWQDLAQHHEVLRQVEELASVGSRVGISLRFALDRDEHHLPGDALLRSLQATGYTIDLIGTAAHRAADGTPLPPGTARLTPPTGETEVLRTWAPQPADDPADACPDQHDGDTTEVLLEYVSDEAGLYTSRRRFTRGQLTELLLAWDQGEED